MSEDIGRPSDNEQKTNNVDASPKPSTSGPKNNDEEGISDSQSSKSENKRSAQKVKDLIHFVVAISVAMMIVVLYVKFVCAKECRFGTHPIVIYKEKETDSNSMRSIQSLVNALIIIGIVAILTFVMVALFYFRCEKFLIGFLVLSIVVTTFFLFHKCFVQILEKFNIPLDRIVAYLLIWNYTVIGRQRMR